MEAVKAKIKMFSLLPSKKRFQQLSPWRKEVEMRLKMNSDSWYDRARQRRKYRVHDGEEETKRHSLGHVGRLKEFFEKEVDR